MEEEKNTQSETTSIDLLLEKLETLSKKLEIQDKTIKDVVDFNRSLLSREEPLDTTEQNKKDTELFAQFMQEK